MQRTFPTSEPTSLYVELGAGRVDIRAEDTGETRVDIHGDGADDALVEQRGNQIVVVGPRNKMGFFRGGTGLSVQVSMPTRSELTTQLGSADLTVSGQIGEARLKSGSGDIRVADIAADAEVGTGSGDVEVAAAAGEVRIRTGSGNVTIGRLEAAVTVTTGSGDIEVASAAGPAQIKSASGDAQLRDARGDVTVNTASGDVTVDTFHVGSLQARTASGDVRVGIPAGMPVWTDISTVSGRIHSSLQSSGEPAQDQPFVELRATTVSGDVVLQQR